MYVAIANSTGCMFITVSDLKAFLRSHGVQRLTLCIGTCISIVYSIDCVHYSSLCQELNGLFRVLWSGRWAQVSPHGFLQAVWQRIPTFKGHAQQDAQEFLWYRSCCPIVR